MKCEYDLQFVCAATIHTIQMQCEREETIGELSGETGVNYNEKALTHRAIIS